VPITGLYVRFWRLGALFIGGLGLLLSSATKMDLGIFPYSFILIYALSMGTRHRTVERSILQLLENSKASSNTYNLALCSFVVFLAALLFASGAGLLAWTIIAMPTTLIQTRALNVALILILLSLVLMFSLEAMAIRYGWFKDRG